MRGGVLGGQLRPAPPWGQTQLDKSSAEPVVAPPLAAFGGWVDAAWFSPSVVSDPDVVAFELPRLGRLRRQAFHVIDRAMTKAPPRRAVQEARPPKRLAGKVVALIDGAGALRAVASARDRLLFESAPVLFFADIPSARLKPRSANKLRRDLVSIGARACVVRSAAEVTTLMVWPSSETGITEFVEEAGPDYLMHPEWDAEPKLPSVSQARPGASPPARDAAREARLLRQIVMLQGQVDALTRAQSTVGAMEQLGLDDARLKSMLKLLHPDRHGNSEAANEAAKWLNSMRELLKAKDI